MNDKIRRFELLVLRPLWVAVVVATVISAATTQWWWVAAGVIGLFYLGVIGSKLHPLQSARELAKGPTTGPVADMEAACLPDDIKTLLVGHACTRVAALLGVITAALLIARLRLSWYAGLGGAWVVILFLGAILKVLFGVVPAAKSN